MAAANSCALAMLTANQSMFNSTHLSRWLPFSNSAAPLAPIRGSFLGAIGAAPGSNLAGQDCPLTGAKLLHETLAARVVRVNGGRLMRKIRKPRTNKPRITNKLRGVAGWGAGDEQS